MSYCIADGKVFSKNGLPTESLYFCDGRLAFSFDKQGINEIRYFMPFDKSPNPLLFRRNIFDCFRCFAEKDGLRYIPQFCNAVIYPYGICSDWIIEGSVFKLTIAAVNESIFFLLEGDTSYEFAVSFYSQTQVMTHSDSDFETFDYGLQRKWSEWKRSKDGWDASVSESQGEENFTLKVKMLGSSVSRIVKTAINDRYTVYAKGEERFIAIILGKDNAEFVEKEDDVKNHYKKMLEKQHARYDEIVSGAPRLSCKNSGIEKFIALAPLYHESLKPLDATGCVRAHTARYWVWGWDSIISNMASLLFGNSDYIRDMLDYFESNADPERGLAHGISFGNTFGSPTAIAAQGIYISLLELYYDYTRDINAVAKHYAFAKKIFLSILGQEGKIKGLIESSSLFPDYVKLIKETGRDISLFNNSAVYPAIRSMEVLAVLMDDADTAERARKFYFATEKNFFPAFWNSQKKYFVSSIDADDLTQRDCYITCGYFWDGGYHEELIGKYLGRFKDFIVNNAIGKSGFRYIPIDSELYDGDANQLHCCWPAVEEVIVRVLNRCGCRKYLKQWEERISYWTNRLTCPEGISSQFETETPEFDRWNCMPGIWQAYSLRKWYSEILNIYCGIEIDYGGFSFDAPLSTYEIRNVKFCNKKVRIKCVGKGKSIEYLRVNGNMIYCTQKVPIDMLKKNEENEIIVKLCNSSYKGLVRAYGVEISDYRKQINKITFTASGLGIKEIYFANICNIFVEGEKVIAENGKIRINFQPEKKYTVECELKYPDKELKKMLKALSSKEPIIETYKKIRDKQLNVHIFTPKDEIKYGIMCIHGGGWHSDSAERFYKHCSYFSEKGFLAVTVDYGLLGHENNDVRELTKDCADALVFLRRKYPGVPFLVLGESAGGYMATSLGNKKILQKIAPECRIADGVIDLDGIVDLKGKWGYGINENSCETDVLQVCKEHSPVDNVSSGDAPVYILHGEADSIVSINDSRQFIKECTVFGVRSQMEELQGIDHAFILFDYVYDNSYVLEMLQFLTAEMIRFFNLD